MTKHSRALPCIDPTKARIWHALDVLKQTIRKMAKFQLYRNNIFSPHHRKVNGQLPHTRHFFVTATPQFWSLSHRVTQGRRNRGGRWGLCPPTSFVGGPEYLLAPPLSTRPKLNHVLKKGINIIRYNVTNGYSPATKRAFT